MPTKKSVKPFKRLTKAQQLNVAKTVSTAVNRVQRAAFCRPGYEAVSGSTQYQRRPSVVELTGEDGVLNAYKRLKLADLSRQAMRNGPARRTIDQQRRVNIVGTIGGKLTCTFDDEAAAKKVMDFFNGEWAPNCEFTDSLHFNDLLKNVVTSIDTTGDIILVFDDGELTGGMGTGRIRAFESDEIANLDAAAFKRFFDPDADTQISGKVYDTFGRFEAAVVSTSQRGMTQFSFEKGVHVLRRDPMAIRNTTNWVFVGNRFRLNQGRGISPLAAAINCLTDIHEIAASETQAAKMNSKLVGQVVESMEEGLAPEARPDAFNPDALGDLGESEEDMDGVKEFTLEEMDAIGAHFDKMPPGLKLELLDTKRPNANMPQYLDWLLGQAAATLGMTRVYSTLKAETSYTAFRGEQCLAWPTFEEAQKDLERNVCDWAVRQAVTWAIRTKRLSVNLPADWESRLSWSWPRAREVNEVDATNAIRAKLQLGLTTYREVLGPNYKSQLDEWKREVNDFREAGIPHVANQTVAGAIVEEVPAGEETERKETTDEV